MQSRDSLEAIEGQGLTGDAAFGTARRQILLIDRETLDRFGLDPGDVRENITTQGIPLETVPLGTRLRMDGVVLEVTAACTPCDYIDSLRPGLRKEIAGRRGMLAKVERGGAIRVGSPIDIEPSAGSPAHG